MSEASNLQVPQIKVGERVLPDPAKLDGKWPFRKGEPFLGLAELPLFLIAVIPAKFSLRLSVYLMILKLCLHTGFMIKMLYLCFSCLLKAGIKPSSSYYEVSSSLL